MKDVNAVLANLCAEKTTTVVMEKLVKDKYVLLGVDQTLDALITYHALISDVSILVKIQLLVAQMPSVQFQITKSDALVWNL